MYTTDVIIEEQEFAESKKNQSEEQRPPIPSPEQGVDDFMSVPAFTEDDELPFS